MHVPVDPITTDQVVHWLVGQLRDRVDWICGVVECLSADTEPWPWEINTTSICNADPKHATHVWVRCS